MTLEETTAYLNRVTDFDWEYIEPIHGRWKFAVTGDDHRLTVYLKVNEEPNSKAMRGALKSVDAWFASME